MSKICEGCGRRMGDRSLASEVKIGVCADFDGVGAAPEAGIEPEQETRELLSDTAKRDPDDTTREVYCAARPLWCPVCRDRYLAYPRNVPLRGDFP